ncbi:MAG: amidophosphoribosyltransferase [Planctomycetes bacterium]|nr:amidophosphoribosyltransferase [Planctomycetota bacterium]
MSDFIGHHCGVALVRLKRPLAEMQRLHGDPLWGLRKLYLLMEKQHNRGQDGAGIASVKFDTAPGEPFLSRLRNSKRSPIERIFDAAMGPALKWSESELRSMDPLELKRRIPMLGEVMLGHLRYGTSGGRGESLCHPYIRRSNVASRNLAIAGNFNLTNAGELFQTLAGYGLNPVGDTDTGVVLEKIGHFLDVEHDLHRKASGQGSLFNLDGVELAHTVAKQLDLVRVLEKATADFDGGYVFVGLLGHGDCFVCRDPNGIRPVFVLETDDVVAAASERAALTTVFDVPPESVKALPPGEALIVRRDGEIIRAAFRPPDRRLECSFERIYFSRGNDPDIYQERKRLGRSLAEPVLQRTGEDFANIVFGFIPNTSEPAFLGLVEEVEQRMRTREIAALTGKLRAGTLAESDLAASLGMLPRVEKIAHKDQRLRTFITHDAARRDLVTHVYDVTRGVVRENDTLVMVDDSIVRGTTLRDSIVTMLARLRPSRIVIASSAPPICYPDCYGIDMSQLGRFIAFEAAVGVIRDRGDEGMFEEIERLCLEQATLPPAQMKNHVRRIYDAVSHDELCDRIARLIRPESLAWKGRLEVVYQRVEGLAQAMPEHKGVWYFTGDYPTPGGLRVLNTAYLNWRKKLEKRAY